MNIENFLQVDNLDAIRRAEIRSGKIPFDRAARHAEFLLGVGEAVAKYQLEESFDEFNWGRAPRILMDRLPIQKLTTHKAYERHRAKRGEISPAELSSIQNKYARNALQVAALTASAGIIHEEAPIHVHDVCAGTGGVSLGVKIVRKEKETSVTAWERVEGRQSTFDKLMADLLPEDAGFEFCAREVADADLSQRLGRPTFCLGKHCCGSSSSDIIQNIQKLGPDERPVRTVIMPCCRGNGRNEAPFDANSNFSLTPEDWFKLMRMAGSPEYGDKVSEVLTRVAKRIADVTRIANLPDDLYGSVHELFPCYETAPENHGIIIVKAA